MEDYIPEADAEFRTWAEQFAGGIESDASRFALMPAQAASIRTVVDDFVLKLQVSSNEATRTKVTIADTQDARSVCESLCRQYAIQIKQNAGISDGDKLSIGVRPVNTSRQRIGAPTTFPLLGLLGSTPGVQVLRFADSATPTRRARPFGAAGMQLLVAVTDAANAPLSEASRYLLVTRSRTSVEFGPADDGMVATYRARWYTRRGEVGPWSSAVSLRIAA